MDYKIGDRFIKTTVRTTYSSPYIGNGEWGELEEDKELLMTVDIIKIVDIQGDRVSIQSEPDKRDKRPIGILNIQLSQLDSFIEGYEKANKQ